MNKKRTLIMALICTAIPVATQAQENLIKAFDDFLNSKGNTITVTGSICPQTRIKRWRSCATPSKKT